MRTHWLPSPAPAGSIVAATLIAALAATGGAWAASDAEIDYRATMRQFVQTISQQAKAVRANFIVIPQSAMSLITLDGDPEGEAARNYLDAIDAVSQEHAFFGGAAYDQPTPEWGAWLVRLMDRARTEGLAVLATDYAGSPARIDAAVAQYRAHGFIGFLGYGEDFALDTIPPYPPLPTGANERDIGEISQAANYLALLNGRKFETNEAMLTALGATDYDLLVIDAYAPDGAVWTSDELARLGQKANGGKRLVIAYMNIGLAEEFRPYWQQGWRAGAPDWIVADYDSEYFAGEYWVAYWRWDWQRLIYDGPESYLARIVAAGFDGVFLDNVEAYEYFEAAAEAPAAAQ